MQLVIIEGDKEILEVSQISFNNHTTNEKWTGHSEGFFTVHM